LVSIANLGKDRLGYVLVGVAENIQTAARIENIFGAKALPYENFWITGVDHEIAKIGKSPDQFFQLIVDKIRRSEISEPLKSYVASNLKPVRYYDKTVYVFEAKGMPEPSLYGDDYYIRSGAQIEKLEPQNLSQLFRRYL
jgi:predicted HTH transcriptional regulator